MLSLSIVFGRSQRLHLGLLLLDKALQCLSVLTQQSDGLHVASQSFCPLESGEYIVEAGTTVV